MSNADCNLTQDYLKSILRYDSETGEFAWVRKIPHSKPGLKPGGVCAQGYWRIKINKKTYKAHRLAWLYVHGEFPKEFIDHINGIKVDNRICNLRMASNAENQMNRAKPAYTNNSGFLGVNLNKDVNKFAARIQVEGKRLHLGYFDTPEEASCAYMAKKLELTKFFNPQRA